MPAELEEIIVTPDARQAQQRLPDLRNRLFHLPHRRLVPCARHRGLIRRRQRVAIQLPVGRQREGLQYDKGARNHVLGQHRGQLATQQRWRQLSTGVLCDIRYQPLSPGAVLARQHHRFVHPRTSH